MNYKEIFIIISSKVNMPTSQISFEKRFPLHNFQWKDMYRFWLIVIVNAYLRSFQYKILNMFLVYHLSHTRLTACSFFKREKQAMSHLFYFCTKIQHIWNQVQTISLIVCIFTANTTFASVGFHNIDNDTFLIQNHTIL